MQQTNEFAAFFALNSSW